MSYEQPGHPESPKRISTSYEFLKSKEWDFVEPKEAREEDILFVHTKNLLENVKTGNFYDMDTPILPNIYEHALLSAGAAIKASEIALEEGFAFSLMRPPGHHAGKNFLGGFCYFNNIAVAVTKALQKLDRVALIDIDVHHGNGSQHILFNNPKVLYTSIHQHPLFPGTGLKTEKNCINYPIPAGTEENEYLKTLKKLLKQVKQFNPDLIAVSAGFDTYKEDPLGGVKLEKSSYRKMGNLIKELNKPTFAVLEGGYSEALPECIYRFLGAFKT